jgi:hypothetical protein
MVIGSFSRLACFSDAYAELSATMPMPFESSVSGH